MPRRFQQEGWSSSAESPGPSGPGLRQGRRSVRQRPLRPCCAGRDSGGVEVSGHGCLVRAVRRAADGDAGGGRNRPGPCRTSFTARSAAGGGGNAGGAEVLAADAAGALGIDVPEFSTATEDELLEATGAVGAANPVDLGAAATPQTLERAIRVVLTSGEVDAVLVKCLGAPDADPRVLVADGSKLPVFPFPEAAVRALGHVMQYADWRARPQGVVPTAGRNRPTSRPMS